jgi:hypothetical protein
VAQNLNMSWKFKIANKSKKRIKSCEECCCIDSKDNPILEEFEGDTLVKCLCMMCYADKIDEIENPNH